MNFTSPNQVIKPKEVQRISRAFYYTQGDSMYFPACHDVNGSRSGIEKQREKGVGGRSQKCGQGGSKVIAYRRQINAPSSLADLVDLFPSLRLASVLCCRLVDQGSCSVTAPGHPSVGLGQDSITSLNIWVFRLLHFLPLRLTRA